MDYVTLAIYAVSALGLFGFGFIVGNRSARGEGAAALADAQAALASVKAQAAKSLADAKAVVSKIS